MDFVSADSLPWLQGAQQRLRAALAAQRLPHSLLLLSNPGLGAEQLANWITALVLCESLKSRPCGVCASCLLLRSDSHPDSYVVRLEEDAQQIKVDQVRDLIESLSLKSYRGGYKVGVIPKAPKALKCQWRQRLPEDAGRAHREHRVDHDCEAEPSPAGDHRQPLFAAGVDSRPVAEVALAWLEAHAWRLPQGRQLKAATDIPSSRRSCRPGSRCRDRAIVGCGAESLARRRAPAGPGIDFSADRGAR